jgi:hypothetical protein
MVVAVMVVKGVELEVEAKVEDEMAGAATVELTVGAATAAAMGTAETEVVMGAAAAVGVMAGEARVEATVAAVMAKSTK